MPADKPLPAADRSPLWEGRPLCGRLVGLAWESEAGLGLTVHASDGQVRVTVPADRLDEFLVRHPDHRFAVEDAVDFHRAAVNATVSAWALPRDGRLYDAGLLRVLVALACHDSVRPDDPPTSDPGGRAETVRRRVEQHLRVAHEEVDRLEINSSVVDRFGPLGVKIEVMSAVAAGQGGTGLRVDPDRLPLALAACRERRDRAAGRLRRGGAAGRWLRYSGGRLQLDNRGFPRTDRKRLAAWLLDVGRSLRRVHDLPVPIAVRTDQGAGADVERVDTDPSRWAPMADLDESMSAYFGLMGMCQLDRQLAEAAGGVVRPKIQPFPFLRTTDPDLAAARRLSVPGLFRPAVDGAQLLVVELPDLELRALAACLSRVPGPGRLAAWFRGGEDPHLELARRLAGMGVDGFCRVLGNDPDRARPYLGLARSALRYLPRGVHPRSLRWIVERDYAVEVATADVEHCLRVVEELLPELHDYLADDTADRFAENLGVSREEVDSKVERLGGGADPSGWLARTLLRSDDPAAYRDLCGWLLAHCPSLLAADPLYGPSGGEIYARLAARDHAYPTGRVCGRSTSWESLGADHLHLADAVRKAALFSLAEAGYPPLGVAGDELVFEAGASQRVDPAVILQVVSAATAGLLGEIPVAVAAGVRDAW